MEEVRLGLMCESGKEVMETISTDDCELAVDAERDCRRGLTEASRSDRKHSDDGPSERYSRARRQR